MAKLSEDPECILEKITFMLMFVVTSLKDLYTGSTEEFWVKIQGKSCKVLECLNWSPYIL